LLVAAVSGKSECGVAGSAEGFKRQTGKKQSDEQACGWGGWKLNCGKEASTCPEFGGYRKQILSS